MNLEYSKCEIAEFIAFNRVLSQSEQNEIEGYLAKKWGVSSQLPSLTQTAVLWLVSVLDCRQKSPPLVRRKATPFQLP